MLIRQGEAYYWCASWYSTLSSVERQHIAMCRGGDIEVTWSRSYVMSYRVVISIIYAMWLGVKGYVSPNILVVGTAC
jgi:hypothetical protein